MFQFEGGLGIERAGVHQDVSASCTRLFGTANLAEIIARDLLDEFFTQLEEEGIEPADMPGHWHFLPPINRPGKIIAMVQNYARHAAEFGNTAPPEPTWFAKLPSSLCGHDSQIVIPPWLEGRVDHEVELAVIIGERVKDLPLESALDVIAGYSVLNDVSARRVQKQDRENKHPWTRCKNLDTFTPMGPYFVAARFVPDPQALRIACRVNGEPRQDAGTGGMIHPVAKQVSVMSRWMTLDPADVIATGTPEGVGALNDGDVCECEIEGIGLLRNRVQRAGAKP
jgi:2-keto-4-pentenoate hydratase/2-oxohepta-3-ene-1,7-dioic acid hydratase in catechol pathway